MRQTNAVARGWHPYHHDFCVNRDGAVADLDDAKVVPLESNAVVGHGNCGDWRERDLAGLELFPEVPAD
jgi:hypothetical protein